MSNLANLHLVYSDQIQSFSLFPNSISELSKIVEKAFCLKGVIFKYMDEEGDYITISNNKELQEISQLLIDLKLANFTILISEGPDFCRIPSKDQVWENINCSECKEKIIGTRFKCTICEDFDFCEFCEMSTQHEHPFIKLLNKDQYVKLENSYVFLEKSSVFKENDLKMNLVEHLTFKDGEPVALGKTIKKTWKVVNSGTVPWPAYTVVASSNSEFSSRINHQVKPGEIVDVSVNLQVPSKGSNFICVWNLHSPTGKVFGDNLPIFISLSSQGKSLFESNLEKLIEIGVEKSRAEMALNFNENNLHEAIKQLFAN